MPKQLTTPQRHLLAIARQTLRMNDVFIQVLGSMTREEAREIVLQLGGGK